MEDLIKRLEQATEGSRELDRAIADAVLTDPQQTKLSDGTPVLMWRYPDGSIGTELRFTTSLDAAMTLVPEGYGAKVEWWHGTDKQLWANAVVSHDDDPKRTFTGDRIMPSAALALCIAALRARQEG